jgi:hypothetical protein
MAKQRKTKQSSIPQTLSEKIHEAEVSLTRIVVFIVFLVELLQFLLYMLTGGNVR